MERQIYIRCNSIIELTKLHDQTDNNMSYWVKDTINKHCRWLADETGSYRDLQPMIEIRSRLERGTFYHLSFAEHMKPILLMAKILMIEFESFMDK